jgi:hypothetical protein
MWFSIAQTPCKVVVCLNKVSVLLLYMRIFVTRTFRVFCWMALIVVLGWSIGSIFATIFQCVPLKGSWDKTLDARCINSDTFWISYGALNIVTDVMVLALPMPMIWKLQMKLRDRIMLIGVFLLGGL